MYFHLSSSAALFDSLQNEFCPPLDSSLVAALLADIDFDDTSPTPAASNVKRPQPPQHLQASIDALRDTLKQLAAQAEVESQLSDFSNLNIPSEQADETTTTATTNPEPDLFTSDEGRKVANTNTTRSVSSETSESATSSSSSSASASGSSQQSFDSPLGFLQAALPHVPTKRLKQALLDSEKEIGFKRSQQYPTEELGDEDGELDMWEVVASILSVESIREMEERGIAGLDEDDEILARALAGNEFYEIEEDDERSWEIVETKKKKKKKPHKNGWERHHEPDFLHHRHTSPKVGGKKKHKQTFSSQRQPATTKITLGDVRQQQHVRKLSAAPKFASTNPTSAPAPDPWTQVSSLSSHLETLVTPHPASFFQSYFHSPKYSSPYDALCAALQSVCNSTSPTPTTQPKTQHRLHSDESRNGDEFEHTTLLFNLLDILLPQYEIDHISSVYDLGDDDDEPLRKHQRRFTPAGLDAQRTRLISDIELAVRATLGRGDDALDLVKLLRELDEDKEGGWKVGVYHHGSVSSEIRNNGAGMTQANGSYVDSVGSRPGVNTVTRNGVSRTTSIPKPPLAAPPIPPPPQNHSTGKNRPSPYQWQAVHPHKASPKPIYTLAHHLPTYTKDVNGRVHRRVGSLGLVSGSNANGWVKGMDAAWGTKGVAEGADIGAAFGVDGDTYEYQKKIGETMRKRDELLREAARMWQRGNRKTRGGEVAWYFAERAREFQELARQESLNAAREMVLNKRMASGNQDTVDLHGTTVSEGLAIVKEVLRSYTTSQAKPLKVITGRGTHSANRVGVLKPAIKKALVEDGWVVGTWEGGLVVRGRRS